MFDSLEIDYKNNTVMFDMVQANELGEETYKLIKRETKKTKKNVEEK